MIMCVFFFPLSVLVKVRWQRLCVEAGATRRVHAVASKWDVPVGQFSSLFRQRELPEGSTLACVSFCFVFQRQSRVSF